MAFTVVDSNAQQSLCDFVSQSVNKDQKMDPWLILKTFFFANDIFGIDVKYFDLFFGGEPLYPIPRTTSQSGHWTWEGHRRVLPLVLHNGDGQTLKAALQAIAKHLCIDPIYVYPSHITSKPWWTMGVWPQRMLRPQRCAMMRRAMLFVGSTPLRDVRHPSVGPGLKEWRMGLRGVGAEICI